MNDTITAVHAWEALDSRGRPTVACRIELADGSSGRAIVPSGASTGTHEAIEKRDGGDRYNGYGTRDAVTIVRDTLAPLLHGRRAAERRELDHEIEALDGTPNFHTIGGNTALAVSTALALADAQSRRLPLWQALAGRDTPTIPMPMVNIISGGAHAARAIDLQDFLAVPLGADSFAEAIEWVERVRAACAQLITDAGGNSALVADEGGLAAQLDSNEAALRLLTAAIEKAGFSPLEHVGIAIDVAANQLTTDGRVHLATEGVTLEPNQWIDRLTTWVAKYPVVSIEDPLAEDAWSDWPHALTALSAIQLVGDDHYVTNAVRLQRGIDERTANAVLIKPNQAGSITRTEDVMSLAAQHKLGTVVSARSGDTEDYWLADLAVGWNAGQIKVGSTMRSERTAKWNRLLELEARHHTTFATPATLSRRA